MTTSVGYKLSANGIEAARARIASTAKVTPVLTSQSLNELVSERVGRSVNLHFKCENLQKTGSFKCRGAVNAVAKLLNGNENEKIKGFVTHSSGNHGQALACAAKALGSCCVVVVPCNAPKAKVAAIAAYGAEIVPVQNTITARKAKCVELAEGRELRIVDPHDDWDVMEGQGTIAPEFLEQVPELDALLVSTGGGGLAGGVAQWMTERHPEIKVFCIEPEGKDIRASVEAGRRLWTTGAPLDTIADGVRVRPLGERCFEVVRRHCEKRVFAVSNADIEAAWRLIWERLKVVIEPSAAMPLAALLRYPHEFAKFEFVHVGLLLCGGNVDFAHAVSD